MAGPPEAKAASRVDEEEGDVGHEQAGSLEQERPLPGVGVPVIGWGVRMRPGQDCRSCGWGGHSILSR